MDWKKDLNAKQKLSTLMLEVVSMLYLISILNLIACMKVQLPAGRVTGTELEKLGNQKEFTRRVCVYEFVSSSLFVSVCVLVRKQLIQTACPTVRQAQAPPLSS